MMLPKSTERLLWTKVTDRPGPRERAGHRPHRVQGTDTHVQGLKDNEGKEYKRIPVEIWELEKCRFGEVIFNGMLEGERGG